MISAFRFIDLFAGIGGFRLAFEAQGGRCVFSSEWDKFAARTYEANFGDRPAGDIRAINAADIPEFDILCGGFPCQAFSIAGVSKKNALGRPHGFEDDTQGTLFFEVARILKERRPPAFVLENVKNLLHHDGGRTFEIVRRTLEVELGYHIKFAVINAADYVPQNRERIFIVGFLDLSDFARFDFPAAPERPAPALRDILGSTVDPKFTLSDRLWRYLQDYKEKHRKAGHGFGYALADLAGPARTLSARYYKDGSEILIPQPGRNPRRLTPRECARLMGYADTFEIPVSNTQAYRQFGNSVVVPVVGAIAGSVAQAIGAPAPVGTVV